MAELHYRRKGNRLWHLPLSPFDPECLGAVCGQNLYEPLEKTREPEPSEVCESCARVIAVKYQGRENDG